MNVTLSVEPTTGSPLSTEFTLTAEKDSVTEISCEFGFFNKHGLVKIDSAEDFHIKKQTVTTLLPSEMKQSRVQVYTRCYNQFGQQTFEKSLIKFVEQTDDGHLRDIPNLIEKMEALHPSEPGQLRVADVVSISDYLKAQNGTLDKEYEVYITLCGQVSRMNELQTSDIN